MDRDVGVNLLNDPLDLIVLSLSISPLLRVKTIEIPQRCRIPHLRVVNLYVYESSLLGHAEFVLRCTSGSFVFSNAPLATALGVARRSARQCVCE